MQRTRFMPYDKADFRYIMINKYHDVIHDYGPGATDERWEKVQTQLLRFDPSRFTFGGVKIRGVRGSMRRSTSVPNLKNGHKTAQHDTRIIQNIMRIIKERHSIRLLSDDEYSDMLLKFVESVNTKICFNTFYTYFDDPITFYSIFFCEDTLDDYTTTKLRAKRSDVSSVKDLFTQISYYIRSYVSGNADEIITHFRTLNNSVGSLVNLFDVLDKYILISIYDTAVTVRPTHVTYTIKRRGGARSTDTDLETDKLVNLIGQLTNERDTLIQNIYEIYQNFIGKTELYSNLRLEALKRTKDILKSHGQMHKYGTVDNASSFMNKCCFFPPVPRSSRQASKTQLEFLNECFLDYYNTGLIDYYIGIRNGLKAEEEAARLRQERDAIRAGSGQMTRDQRLIRDQFCSLIAKLGLVLNGEYAENGTQLRVENIQGKDDTMTAKDVNLMANWAKWRWDPNLFASRISVSGARSNIDVDLFDKTHDHFKQYIINSNNYPICTSERKLKYIIDNAAMVPNNLKDYVFCPVSSVVDGMKKCNVSQLEEYGDMDFFICEKEQYDTYTRSLTDTPPPITGLINHYYNGKSIYNPTDQSTTYEIKLLTPYLGVPIVLTKYILLAGTALEAHNVLRETLVKIIDFIIWVDTHYSYISACVFQNANDIFGGLYECLFNTKYTIPNTDPDADPVPFIRYIFLQNILNILFKGAGDFFQEINAVCKWGGYIPNNYFTEPGVIPYTGISENTSNTGNALRMFIANDQPSGCRFAFLLLNGYREFINEYAFGGYMGIGKTLLVTRADISTDFRDQICKPTQHYRQVESIVHGGKRTKRKNRYSKKSNRSRN